MDQPAAAGPRFFARGVKLQSKAVDYLNGDKEANIKIISFDKADNQVKDAYLAWIDKRTTEDVAPCVVDQKICLSEMDKYYKSNSMISGLQISGHETRNLWGPTQEGNYIHRYITQIGKCAAKRGFNGFRNSIHLYKVITTEGEAFFLSDTLIWSERTAYTGFRRQETSLVKDAATQTDLTSFDADLEGLRCMGDDNEETGLRLHFRKGRRKMYQSDPLLPERQKIPRVQDET